MNDANRLAQKFGLYIKGWRNGRAIYSIFNPDWSRAIRKAHGRSG